MKRSILTICVGLAFVLAIGASAGAQDGSENDVGQRVRASAPGSGPAAAYPQNPRGFFRGNLPPGTGSSPAGFYLSLWCFIPVLALFGLWTWSANWLYADSRSLKIHPEFWSSVLLVSGFVGLLSAVLMPYFFLGFLLLLSSYAIPLGLYVKERNARVPQSAKI